MSMQRVLLLARRGLGPGPLRLPPRQSLAYSGVRRGLASSSAASSDDGGVNAPATFSPEKMEKGTWWQRPGQWQRQRWFATPDP